METKEVYCVLRLSCGRSADVEAVAGCVGAVLEDGLGSGRLTPLEAVEAAEGVVSVEVISYQ